ncbi:MAG TPA: T9SS type A sorting domain-containing protein [Saprospiraceae bacterium]|nr:T9SS type A sorting domain-containing protein [Saprospiraceae bacterium]
MDWFRTPQADIEKVLFKDFQRIPFLKDCAVSTATSEVSNLGLVLSPNPASQNIVVQFDSNGGYAEIDVFDVRGSSLKSVSAQKFDKGQVKISVGIDQLVPGMYYMRISQGGAVSTQKFVKM